MSTVGRSGGATTDWPLRPPEWLERAERPFVLIYVTNHGGRQAIEEWLRERGYAAGEDYLAVG
jgi:hypothetical protein